jgi:4-amino-4-deoxy-L-arabinose transferase and related glycosyltransferases of PMT family
MENKKLPDGKRQPNFARLAVPLTVIVLLSVHAGLLAWSATRHSPTLNEPGHLVAGLTHWKFGRFEVYRVNPPLTHYVAAIPVMLAGYQEDWSGFYDSPGARPEFRMGEDFIKANGERSIWLFTIARWGCIPFSLIGGLFCFFWSKELWKSNLAGLISLTLWCFEPNILAHGELVTPDCAASAFGLGACYLFWRWLEQPTWGRALATGMVLGLAELTKTSWVILFGLFPVLWIFWLWTERKRGQDANRAASSRHVWKKQSLQLAATLLLALYLINLAYGFDGSFTPLKSFEFVSHALGGHDPGVPGNRFRESWLGELPLPVPKQYVRGIDLQKKDFEDYGQPSYLRGEWKDGGWWYYYIYGLAVKTPHGSQLLVLLAMVTVIYYRKRLVDFDISPRDLVILLTVPTVLMILVSSQLEFNHHVRYVLPVLGYLYVLSGVVSLWFTAKQAGKIAPRHDLTIQPVARNEA